MKLLQDYETDTLLTWRLKMFYLVPLEIALWPLIVLYVGIKEQGWPVSISDLMECWKGEYVRKHVAYRKENAAMNAKEASQ